MSRAVAPRAALCVAVLLGGCIPQYRPPTLAEPHAIVKLRRSYDTAGGSTLRERILVDEHLAYQNSTYAALAASARINSILVHPKPATFEVSSGFFHMETRQVWQTYYEQVPYTTTESYDCSSGSGTSRSYRTCSRTVTSYRSEPRQRWVTETFEVDDGSCGRTLRFAPAPGRVYLLQYSYQEPNACSLACFEQIPATDGTFQNQLCPVAPPAD